MAAISQALACPTVSFFSFLIGNGHKEFHLLSNKNLKCQSCRLIRITFDICISFEKILLCGNCMVSFKLFRENRKIWMMSNSAKCTLFSFLFNIRVLNCTFPVVVAPLSFVPLKYIFYLKIVPFTLH